MKFLFGLCLLSLPLLGSSQQDMEDIGRVQGRVKVMVATAHKAIVLRRNKKLIEGERFYKHTFVFDSKGNLIESVACNKTDSQGFKSVSVYNNKSQATKVTSSDLHGKIWVSMMYSYTDDGNLSSLLRHGKAGILHSRNTYTYNEKGQKTEELVYASNSVLSSRSVFTYTDKGKQGSVTYYDPDGQVTQRRFEQWGNSARTHYLKDCKPDSTPFYEVSSWYKYDTAGNMLESFEYIKGRDTLGAKFEYDQHNNRVKTEPYRNGEARDWLCEQNEYTYDPIGNWTKRVRFVNNKPVSITFREIEYYPEEQK